MKMFVVVLILMLQVIPSLAATCPLYTVDNTSYYAAPTTVSPAILGYNSSCCTAGYGALVANYSDALTSYALSLFSKAPTAACKSMIQSVGASLCSPKSSSWVRVHAFGIDLRPCPSFCALLQTTCASSTLTGYGPVPSLDAESVCFYLFSVAPWRVFIPNFTPTVRPGCWATAGTCGSNDYFPAYTACSSQTRSVVYQWVNGSTCQGGDSLPTSITGLPCELTCPRGQYLPIGTTQCVNCPAGTFSIGGGTRISIWKQWPTSSAFELTSYCLNRSNLVYSSGFDKPCAWQLSDSMIISGNISDYASSVLEIRTYVSRNGAFEFAYQIDAEVNYDGLYVGIDGIIVYTDLRQVSQWTVFRQALASGPHIITISYRKDSSFSAGLDSIFISYIQIEGTDLVGASCSACPAGTFSAVGAANCSSCPMNTYSNDSSAQCTACSADTYAYPGSRFCTTRPACTTSDYTWVFSNCTMIDNQPQRSKSAQWIQPQICQPTNVTLPATITGLACSPCNPGEYRTGANCNYCPPGTISSQPDATSCTPCTAGSISINSLVYTRFDSWPPEFSTRCTGSGCGSTGWRLLSNSIDSGIGHSYPAESTLSIAVNLSQPGVLRLAGSLQCQQFCSLSIRFSSQSFSRGTISGATLPFYNNYSVAAGPQIISLAFVKSSLGASQRSDRVVLTSISISGTTTGGGAECRTCALGYSSPNQSTVCTACPAGTFRNSSYTTCQPCSNSSYSASAGSVNCETCGHLINSLPNRTACDLQDCIFEAAPNVVYDLTPLKKTNEMWGPIYDLNGQTYYLNVCNKYHSNKTCYDSNGAPIVSFACQVTSAGLGKDLGHVMGYYPLNGSAVSTGLLVEYLHGTVSNGNCNGRERSTTIVFVCDPLAGIGYPAGIEPVETSRCVYQFTWHSRYACPLCTQDDYFPVVSDCVNNSQVRTWLPLNYPQLCVDDNFPTPPPETLSCQASDLSCPPGQYLSVDPLTRNATCALAPIGYFSPGGTLAIDDFSDLDEVGLEGNWLAGAHYAQSGPGDTTMELRVNLVVPGNLTFDYKVYQTGNEDDNDGFNFWIDGLPQLSAVIDTGFRYRTFSLSSPLGTGPHVFRWEFAGGEAPSLSVRFKGALVRRIRVVGVARAALSPTPCPAGTYAPVAGMSSCLVCGTNTFSQPGASSCLPCPDNQHFSLPGSSYCLQKQPCVPDDFILSYSDCSNNSRVLTYQPLQPQICRIPTTNVRDTPVYFVPPDPQTVACAPCAPGTHRMSNGECTRCPLGTGHMHGDMTCVAAPIGSFAAPISSYFVDDSLNEWPEGFSTYCSGLSCISPGWRFRGGEGLDSGFHAAGEVDSVLDLVVNLVADGYISFRYRVLGSLLDGLEFWIDEDQQAVVYHPIQDLKRDDTPFTTFQADLSAGVHLLRWVYHQDHQNTTVFSKVQLQDIEIDGDSLGAADSIDLCPAGTYSDSTGQIACTPCPPGTASDQEGQTSCPACPAGTYQPLVGQTVCSDCGSGTFSTSNFQSCTTNHCNFQFNTSYGMVAYNLSQFSGPILRVYYDNVDIELELCDQLPSDSVSHACPDHAYVCGFNTVTSTSINLGAHLSVTYIPPVQPNTTDGSGIRFLYENGDRCRGGTEWSTELVAYCYDDIDNPPIRRRVLLGDCRYSIIYNTMGGCPTCTDADYRTVRSDCNDGVRTVSVVRSSICNGPSIRSTSTQSCTAGYETPLWVFFGLTLGFAVIAALLIFFIVRHRQISDKYELLQNEESRQSVHHEEDREEM